jgi:N6-adenosine-specific RNA methylase IME4
MIIPLPNKKYNIIYADPPWEVKAGPDWGSSGKSKDLKYPTMSIDEISSMPVNEICHNDCHLYLWTINKYIEQSYHVARSWGFKPICLLTWIKNPHGIGLGGAFIQTTEHLLFCRKGILRSKKRIDTTWFEHKRLTHSEKPHFFRELITSVSGDLPRIELFARNEFPGWDAWGNEINKGIKNEESNGTS